MPEEINRVVTDRIADLLLTPSRDGDENLLREGVPASKIKFVGNIMIDTLFQHLPMAGLGRVSDRITVAARQYAVLTLHRPSNVDRPETFRSILDAVNAVARDMPWYSRASTNANRIAELGLSDAVKPLTLVDPLGYIDFLSLTSHARLILTDSGGLQEESTALGIPCLTLRETPNGRSPSRTGPSRRRHEDRRHPRGLSRGARRRKREARA